MPFHQGEVYEYEPTDNLGADREGEYHHRALIVSAEEFNRGTSNNARMWTILFTTKKNDLPLRPTWVRFETNPEFGLSQPCIIQAENMTRSPERYLGKRLGRISDEKMEEIVAAVGCVMGASCYFL